MDIYLDDYHLHSTTQTLHTTVKRPLAGLEGGEPRITVYNNPGEAGETVSQILDGASLITIPGSLRAINGTSDQEKLDDYAAARREFIRATGFSRSPTGRVLPKTLRVTMPDGSAYQATVYRNNRQLPVEWNTYGTWLLELRNPSGVLESQAVTSVTLTLPEPGGLIYPVTYPVVYGASTGGSAGATNYGDAEAKPVITLYGPMENPVITNETTGQFIRLNTTIASGRRIVINTATPSIVEGNLTSTLTDNRQDTRGEGSRFWRVKPGANSFRLRAAAYDVGYATVEFRSAFSGV